MPRPARNSPDAEASQEPTSERPSKTQRKARAHSLQALGEDLARLSDEQLARIEMPEVLRDAIIELRRTRSHEGRRRQRQLVGKLMRQLDDASALRESLAAIQLGGARNALALHQAEYWRDALVADDAHLARFVTEHANVDIQQLRSLIRHARAEGSISSPPGAAPRRGKAWRELFRFIRPALESANDPTP